MSGKLQFREKLNGILELGKEKHRVLTMEDVEKYFEEDTLQKNKWNWYTTIFYLKR